MRNVKQKEMFLFDKISCDKKSLQERFYGVRCFSCDCL